MHVSKRKGVQLANCIAHDTERVSASGIHLSPVSRDRRAEVALVHPAVFPAGISDVVLCYVHTCAPDVRSLGMNDRRPENGGRGGCENRNGGGRTTAEA